MGRRLISTGSHWEKLAGYSRAVVDGRWVFVSGCTGFDYQTGAIADDVEAQTRQTFRNIEAALEEAGARLEDVVRVRVYLADQNDFPRVAPIVGEHFRDVRPANTTVVCTLADARMKVEIEVTALLP
ncbi:MAG: RidA family protein, partial [Alphaproteobacteria bacterium]